MNTKSTYQPSLSIKHLTFNITKCLGWHLTTGRTAIRNVVYAILLLLCGACQDFLQEESISDITSDLIYSDPEGVRTAVAGLYDLHRGYYAHQDAGLSTVRGTDINWSRAAHDMGAARYDAGMSPTNSVVGYNWRQFYRIIERANSIIQAAEQVELSEAERAQVLAETRCFRAMAYYFLLRWFDNIVLMTEPTTDIANDFSPAPASEVWNLITSDLRFAADNLDYDTEQPGRVTKGLAQHLLADVALWLGDWGLAEEMAGAVIHEGPYSLLEDIRDIFPAHDLELNHEESIFTIQFGEGVVGGGGNGSRWCQYFTTQYYNVNGVQRDHEQGGRAWARTHPNDYLLGLYDEEDTRLGVYYRRYYYFNDSDNLPPGKNLGDTVTRDDIGDPYPNIMPSCTKYWDSQRDITSAWSFKNIIAHRLAETYFIAAEALMRQGREAEALEYINPLRQRAGIPDLTEFNEDILLEERAKELAFEGHRWFALKRMGLLVERVRLYGGNEDGNYTHPRENIRDFHVRRPIPQSELDLMPGYPQNDGYF